MHLSNIFGNTLKEIKNYTKNIIKVQSFKIVDSKINRLKVVSKTIESMGKIFSKKGLIIFFLLEIEQKFIALQSQVYILIFPSFIYMVEI